MRIVPTDTQSTPLCPFQGHLPRKGGEGWLPCCLASNLSRSVGAFADLEVCFVQSEQLDAREMPLAPFSPLAGEMSAVADRGGVQTW